MFKLFKPTRLEIWQAAGKAADVGEQLLHVTTRCMSPIRLVGYDFLSRQEPVLISVLITFSGMETQPKYVLTVSRIEESYPNLFSHLLLQEYFNKPHPHATLPIKWFS